MSYITDKDFDWEKHKPTDPFDVNFPNYDPSQLIKQIQKYKWLPQAELNSDGGPSDYYDFPGDWTTFNDFIAYKSTKQWKEYSFHLGNIGKVLCRWGDKAGTSLDYDARKIVYSGCWLLKMILGTEAVREYLARLLDDPQFGGHEQTTGNEQNG